MIEATIPTGSIITYQGIDYTTESEVNVFKGQEPTPVDVPEEVPTPETVDPTPDPIVAPEAPQTSVEEVEITPGETLEITEA